MAKIRRLLETPETLSTELTAWGLRQQRWAPSSSAEAASYTSLPVPDLRYHPSGSQVCEQLYGLHRASQPVTAYTAQSLSGGQQTVQPPKLPDRPNHPGTAGPLGHLGLWITVVVPQDFPPGTWTILPVLWLQLDSQTIRRHDDISLPPQERFQILSALGQDIKINKKFSKASYMSLRDDFFQMAADLDECGKEEGAFVLYHKFLTLYLEKLNIGPKLRKKNARERSNFIKIINNVFERAETLKRKLLNKYKLEYEKYLMEMKEKEEEAAERAAFWEDVREILKTSGCSSWRSVPLDPLYGSKENKSGTTLTAKEAQPSSVPTETSSPTQHRSVEENAKVCTPRASTPAKQPGENNSEKSTENKSGEAGPAITLIGKEAQLSSAPTETSSPPPQCAVGENTKTVSPSTSISSKQPGENGPEESTVQKVRGLHSVIIPHDLCEKFLKAARKNTKKKIETCGVLCGSMIGEEYKITHIVLPLQEGGPDYCYATNEEELFFIQEELGLLTLGWIHTHPTQTAFLSSVDLHTHFGYQQMLPESIAVVCAPKYKETGIFSLTPTGMQEISCCSKRGFHPHREDTPLFCDCDHVTIQNTKVTVTDLR
ncbi:STAM-binding protein-like [Meriones unguiculatus]|uniref:STAM-binding protein-like n=1 Tax=Meriones unguiculatus TaxID=10047 RepID=UPI00293EC9BB|nr:STAM-binding protein-like [Meriones unguiculatus]